MFKVITTVMALCASIHLNAAPLSSFQQQAKLRMLDALEQKVQAVGSVSVIVQLDDAGAFSAGQLTDRARLAAAQDAVIRALGGHAHEVHKFTSLPLVSYRLDEQGLAALRAIGAGVQAVQENKVRRPLLMHSAPLVQAPEAWEVGYDGDGQLVAVIDTGVDSSHPFLAGKVSDEACFSAASAVDGVASVCPGGGEAEYGAGSAMPCGGADEQRCWHGTHVAGIVAGRNESYAGLAPGAGVVAIQAASAFNIQADCGEEPVPCYMFADVSILAALDYVYLLKTQQGKPIAAVNLSLGGERHFENCDNDYPAYALAVNALKSAGVAVVAAAGNDGYPDSIGMPACLSAAVSVGSVCDSTTTYTLGCPQGAGSIAAHSNVYPYLSVLAPGAWITSSVPGGGYLRWQGTSMATPHVAAAFAILKQRSPQATVDQLLSDLRTNAFSVDDTREGGVQTGLRSLAIGFTAVDGGPIDERVQLALEEPASGAVVTGIGNIRGWAIGPDGIDHVDYYVDSALKASIPYGGTRKDVGEANPSLPDAQHSGFAQSYNFGLLAPGAHTVKIRAYSTSGKYKDIENNFNVVRFHKSYFKDSSAVDVSESSVSRDDAGILIHNLLIEGQPYDVRLEWQKPMQQFGIVDIQ